ncbi:mitochondrial fission 1 protein, putative (FIS1) [Babesia microti strain RI]|uniref:Mitochondrial fission 1 protein, putative (FIS1) n=1 Tax=Babesia microti (strain RI) TaxID=1133968 RepID=A0A1R4AAJ5_BABMR|nr:mitochondrial fission 1 protein, putative (FIS1) [Babesia microti strain RI]SJK86010.1 mitochondrial fission 1 protein, putative (FIS1) [Babesia microti strain RI]|eukprot:XP_021338209.1 mitochondrial fission 1 protein, putative (FIS1) [Babesia microti strain RI]
MDGQTEQQLIEENIERFRILYQLHLDNNEPSPTAQFNYACALVCSNQRSHNDTAIYLLDELVRIRYESEECFYQLALAHMKRRSFVKSKEYLDRIIALEGSNQRVMALKSVVVSLLAQDTFMGGLLGATAAFAIILFFTMKRNT